MNTTLSELELKLSVLSKQADVHAQALKNLAQLVTKESESVANYVKRIEMLSIEVLQIRKEENFINDGGI